MELSSNERSLKIVFAAAVPRNVVVRLFLLALGRLVALESSLRLSLRDQDASTRTSLLWLRD